MLRNGAGLLFLRKPLTLLLRKEMHVHRAIHFSFLLNTIRYHSKICIYETCLFLLPIVVYLLTMGILLYIKEKVA